MTWEIFELEDDDFEYYQQLLIDEAGYDEWEGGNKAGLPGIIELDYEEQTIACNDKTQEGKDWIENIKETKEYAENKKPDQQEDNETMEGIRQMRKVPHKDRIAMLQLAGWKRLW